VRKNKNGFHEILGSSYQQRTQISVLILLAHQMIMGQMLKYGDAMGIVVTIRGGFSIELPLGTKD